MKRIKNLLNEGGEALELYRRYSHQVNSHLLGKNTQGTHFSFMKSYDPQGNHEYEHHEKQDVISKLDKHLTKNPLSKPTTVYSGVNHHMGAKLRDLARTPGHTLNSPAYISSSHNKEVAHKFAEVDDHHTRHVLALHLPKGFKKSRDVPNSREKERLIARNVNLKHIKSEKHDTVMYHHYKPV